MRYEIDTATKTYYIYTNEKDEIVKTKGLGHGVIAANSFESASAKSMVEMLMHRLSQNYVSHANLLPVLYQGKHTNRIRAFRYFIEFACIDKIEYFEKNIKKQGFDIIKKDTGYYVTGYKS